MNHRLWTTLLVVGLSSGAALLSSQPAEDKPVWHADWPTAQRLARKEGKPILAVLVCNH